MGYNDIFKITNLSIENLVNSIETGEIGLPDLQRPFVWDTTKVRDLMDSLYKGLPIGSIILWELYKPSNYSYISQDKLLKEPKLLVIDGQQRLTSLFSIIKNREIISRNVKKIKLKIAFNPFEEKFEVSNPIIEKEQKWISDISDIFSQGSWILTKNYLNRLKEKLSEEDEKKISERIEKVQNIKNYSLSVLELNPELDPEEVSDIFIRINSKGKPLNESDFILTLLSVYSKEDRDEIENFCKQSYKPNEEKKPTPFNIIQINPTPSNLVRTITAYKLKRGRLKYAFLILQGRDLEKKDLSIEFRDKNLKLFREGADDALNLTNWHSFIKIIHSAGFVNSNLISSKIAFFIAYSFYLIGKYELNIEDKTLEKLIKLWFIFSQLTQRYTGSPESIIEDDLKNLSQNNFENFIITTIKNNLTNDFWEITLPEILKTSSTTNFAFLTYIASLNYYDVKVLFSEIKLRDYLNPILKMSKKTIDLHHIFPKNYLKKLGYTSKKQVNQVANFIYIEYTDNIKKFGDKDPNETWPDYLQKYYKETINDIYKIYDLPYNFWELSYEDFLDNRIKLIANKIRNFFYSF